MSYVYWIIAYFTVFIIASIFFICRYLRELLNEYRRCKTPLKHKISYEDMGIGILLGLVWPISFLYLGSIFIMNYFENYIPSKLESYAKQKYPEDFI